MRLTPPPTWRLVLDIFGQFSVWAGCIMSWWMLVHGRTDLATFMMVNVTFMQIGVWRSMDKNEWWRP